MFLLATLSELPGACKDYGPWPCEEEGCPSPTVGCKEIAADQYACRRNFADVWETPPNGTEHRLVQEMCRATCGRCAALEDCPESCECRDNVRGCIRLASCGADYVRGGPEPVASELRFHANTDCVALGDGRLAKLDQLQVAELLAALPARLRSLDLAMSGLGSGGGGGGDGGIAPGGFASRAFARFSELRFLNLEFSQLRGELRPDALHGLRKLRTLWLTGNHLRPQEKMFGVAEGMKNALGPSLHPRTLEGLTSLQVLLLHHNPIAELPPGLFTDQVKSLRVLKLLDTPYANGLTDGGGADGVRDADGAPITSGLSDLLVAPAAPRCPVGRPSDGRCLQLDLKNDTGDLLEDLWEEAGLSLADDEALAARFPGTMGHLVGEEAKEEL